MTPSTICPKCHGRMAEGFLLDHTHGSRMAVRWYEGAPVKSFWTGVKLRGRANHAVATFRCGRCGFLESYATGA